jgi:hypothetical protein
MLGGARVLGPVITPIFSYGDRKFQYTAAACLEYDPSLPAGEQYRLSPLGLDMGLYERPVAVPDQPGIVYVDGHVIYDGFLPLYRKLGGSRYTGKPLTELHYDPDRRRFEQYFENVGFYWVETDPPEAVGLLAYGSWKCDRQCSYTPAQNAQVPIPKIEPQPGDSVFRAKVNSLGSDFTGYQVSPAYHTADGKIEQVYQNVVMAVDPTNPQDVILQPVPQMTGFQAQQPVKSSGTPGLVFWPVQEQEQLGYNVPQVFLDYITAHGGIAVSGPPISGLILVNDHVFRQCFTNVCLDYLLLKNIPESLRIRPAAYGLSYQQLNYRVQAGSSLLDTQLKQAVMIRIWKKFSHLASGQPQEIGVSLTEGTAPLKNQEPVLFVTYPDGSRRSYLFSPTGDDGKSVLLLPAFDAPNGTLIPYQVCIYTMTKELFCVQDDFVIWLDQ